MTYLRGILLDIEGTTTPISFVYDVLFPYARAHAAEYFVALAELSVLQTLEREHAEDVAKGLNPPPLPGGGKEPGAAAAYVHWLMDQDRKSTALKSIQGEIWLDGYRRGELRGEVFEDVPRAFARWRRENLDIRIFSSGSVLAQRLLFSTTAAGDLTVFLNGYFDTTTGPKTDPASYARIAGVFALPPGEILFISDVTQELDAARGAGMHALLCVRPGNRPQPPHDYGVVRAFDEVSSITTSGLPGPLSGPS